MRCKKCGSEITDSSIFCTTCGDIIRERFYIKKINNKTSKLKITIIIEVIIAICLIITNLFFLDNLKVFGNLTLAKKYFEKGNYNEVILICNDIIKIEPNNVDVYLLKADALLMLEDYDQSISTIRDAYSNVGNSEKLIEKSKDILIDSGKLNEENSVNINGCKYYWDKDIQDYQYQCQENSAINQEGVSDFDLSFLQLENNENNVIYSPLSIKYALSMLNDGSNGNSKNQIQNIIGDLNVKTYSNSPNIALANALFARDTYKDTINNDYAKLLQEKYNASLIVDPFTDPAPLNNWVNDNTLGLINGVFDESIENQDFMLLNTLAIDMEWQNIIQAKYYDEEKNYDISYKHENFFHYISALENSGYSYINFNNDGQKTEALEIGGAVNKYDILTNIGEDKIREIVTADYYNVWVPQYGETIPDFNLFLDNYIKEINENYGQMKFSTDFLFYDDEEIKVFAKDLKEYDGTTLQYIGIMPKNLSLKEYISNMSETTINNVIDNLNSQEWDNFDDGMITQIVGYIPIFDFEYELDLLNDLKMLGITDVFDQKLADLSTFTSQKGAYINSAKHKSNIVFSNEGIMASAVTVEGGLGADGGYYDYRFEVPIKVIDLTFDKPFMFLIRDKSTGDVWFVGTVYDAGSNNNGVQMW